MCQASIPISALRETGILLGASRAGSRCDARGKDEAQLLHDQHMRVPRRRRCHEGGEARACSGGDDVKGAIRLLAGTLIVVTMCTVRASGGGFAHAAVPLGHAVHGRSVVDTSPTILATTRPAILATTSTVLDYRLIQHFGPTITISDSVTMTNTNGMLSGTAYNIQDKCTATVSGTLQGGIAAFTFRYGAGSCAGRKVTFNGQLGPTAGAGTFITNGGNRGTWNAGDAQDAAQQLRP